VSDPFCSRASNANPDKRPNITTAGNPAYQSASLSHSVLDPATHFQSKIACGHALLIFFAGRVFRSSRVDLVEPI
jgi:hypothetical protein